MLPLPPQQPLNSLQHPDQYQVDPKTDPGSSSPIQLPRTRSNPIDPAGCLFDILPTDKSGGFTAEMIIVVMHNDRIAQMRLLPWAHPPNSNLLPQKTYSQISTTSRYPWAVALIMIIFSVSFRNLKSR